MFNHLFQLLRVSQATEVINSSSPDNEIRSQDFRNYFEFLVTTNAKHRFMKNNRIIYIVVNCRVSTKIARYLSEKRWEKLLKKTVKCRDDYSYCYTISHTTISQ